MRRLLTGMAVVGLLALFTAAVLGMSWAIFDGPPGIRGWALILASVLAGLAVMRRWTIVLAQAGAHPVGMVFTGVVALFFVGTVPAGFSEWLLYERGRLTTCRVLTVTEEEGFNGAGSVHLYRLGCDGRGPLSITQSTRGLQVNQRVRVRHDPEGRLDRARPAGDTAALERHHLYLLAGAELVLLTLASLALVATGRRDP